MKSGFDINRIEGDGYLVVPLSMSRLASGLGQDPEWCYEVLRYFVSKLESYSNDVVFLYTYGLYTNTEQPGFESRKKITFQALNHVVALRNVIEKRKEFIPNAFHYLPLEYVVLNSPKFKEYYSTLKKRESTDETFRKLLQKDMMGKSYAEPNVNFLLEELAIAQIIRQHLVDFPRTLVKRDIWRLIVYAGGPILSDVYVTQQNILSQKDEVNPYVRGQYDFDQKVYNDFSSFSLEV